MLSKRMKQYIAELIEANNSVPKTIELGNEEKEYIEKNNILSDDTMANLALVEKPADQRFATALIELCDKETESEVVEENVQFLHQPLSFLRRNKHQFIYVEAETFSLIGVDGISMEVDDVFDTYSVMLGLKQKKNVETTLKSYLDQHLHGEGIKYSLLFDANEGIWNVNVTLDYIVGFSENLLLAEAYSHIYRFLFGLVESLEKEN
ncbi:branched-chain amino acid aminotransferase [Bacillus sp. FJAT-50079]|uniref:branched-chain amino acid aminotransferase n=1 Tax=Bacillus sp. FJAT-50079 TaxID=2833577 RepID=UPI001BC96951|nr:branched-chain amino acid aminotransferase [Bacillus sp. FJAT-50079]MBS4209921.1 branched-chain amino acid aminotransferase [Bacillus sp. FJAT-50079]